MDKEKELTAAAEEEIQAEEEREERPEPESGRGAVFCASTEKPEELAACIEAILFTMGEAVGLDAIKKALGRTDAQVSAALECLRKRYEQPSSGIMLQFFDDAVQLSTKTEQYGNLIKIARVPRKLSLSDSVLETLSIVAYKQPITKAEVEQIRGVSSDYAINRLLEYELITELGRKEAPGRPILFGTTEQFLRSFGVHSLTDLPSLSAVKTEEFREEAEAEVREKLGV